MVELGLGSPHR